MTETEEKKEKKTEVKKKYKKPGIIYFSQIPQNMTVQVMRDMMLNYGEVGKIFFQPVENEDGGKVRGRRQYAEGWVEFMNKKVAKAVAKTLNCKPIRGKRKCVWYHQLWVMKYLPKFQWVHLNERLEYERMIRKQKVATEIRQAKKEVEFYRSNVERKQIQARIAERVSKRERLKGKFDEEFASPSGTVFVTHMNKPSVSFESKRTVTNDASEGRVELVDRDRDWTFKQKETDDQITVKKRGKGGKESAGDSKGKKKLRVDVPKKAAENKNFLSNLFSGGLNEGAKT